MANPDNAISIQKKLRILVAEDNEINQKLIQRILQTAGHRVDMVDNGLQAVEFFSRTQYDLILMDIQMPLMDGYEATRKIRELQLKAQSAKLKDEGRGQGSENQNKIGENSELKSAIPNPKSQIQQNAEGGMRNKIEKDSDPGDQRPETRGQRSVPIIALTGNNLAAVMEKCLGLGMNDWIGKPLFREPLLSLIEKWTATGPAGSAAGKAQKDVARPVIKKPNAHQPIDLDRALSEFMGEKEVLNGILNEFTEKVRSQIKAIQRAIPSLDFKEIAKEAHSIKGGAANLTANRVAGIASALEKAAGLQQAELAEHLAGELEEKLQQLEIYLQNENITAHGVLNENSGR